MFPQIQNAIHKAAHPNESGAENLGDFTTTPRVIGLSLLAIAIGVVGAYVALALLRLIGLFTNLFFFGRLASALVSPAANRLGLWELLVPVGGALIIGLMARYGSERIRGHGIPEALEAILISGSKVEPKLALLKPLSSAISIGDRRRVWLHDCAAVSPVERGTQDAAGRGRRSGHVGDLRLPGLCGTAGGGTAAV